MLSRRCVQHATQFYYIHPRASLHHHSPHRPHRVPLPPLHAWRARVCAQLRARARAEQLACLRLPGCSALGAVLLYLSSSSPCCARLGRGAVLSVLSSMPHCASVCVSALASVASVCAHCYRCYSAYLLRSLWLFLGITPSTFRSYRSLFAPCRSST